ncbi:myb/sant-like transcription factor [Plakobranchus ocellatus]|uniref:Myb/sant-like transcription factor n=1 Tax=Plakobranchus ocellatus TaxID=259542 RepID=A0AAV4E1V2_9GAST|nr:myb/sant-like transcription factor [Plakobranchus ocellatus]
MKNLIDTELLIKQVEKYPMLWDKENDSYKCATTTASAWREVSRALQPDYDSLEEYEKNSLVQMIMKRWKNVRDAWAKAQKRIAKDITAGGRYPKKYIFQDQLSFLSKVIKFNKGSDSPAAYDIDTESESDDNCQDSDSIGVEASDEIDKNSVTVPSTTSVIPRISIAIPSTSEAAPCSSARSAQTLSIRRKRKINWDDSDNTPPKRTVFQTEIKNNRHFLFFRSLMPTLTQLNEEQILEFQVGVLRILQSVRKQFPDLSPNYNNEVWKIEEDSA